MLGEIAAAAKIAVAAGQGFAALKKLQPEYGRFWKKFEAGLKPEERDIPWDHLKALRVDPDFVGAACGLIRGDHDARRRFRARVVELADPPEGGRYDAGEVVERVMRVADESAVAAAKDDRDVTARGTRLLEGRLDELERNMGAEIRELREAMIAREPPPVAAPPESPRRLRGGPPRPDSKAEAQLGRFLDHDPTIQDWTQGAILSGGSRAYRPDFVVRDHNGVNWFVELKGDHLADRRQAQALKELVERAAGEVAANWRFVLVTPTMVEASKSWSELVARAEDV
jgi:hypothetical protein